MGVARILDSCQRFPPDGNPLSPTALNIIRDNLLALDEATRLGGPVFMGLYGQHAEEAAQQRQVIWRGGGVFLTGMTTLRIVTNTKDTVLSGDTLRVYRGDNNGAALPATYTDHTLAIGTQTHTITLSGHTHGQIVRVQLEVRHAAAPPAQYTGIRVEVVLAEFLPVALPDAAPTLPTFAAASDLNQTKLNQLADYTDWLIRRVALRYDPVFIAYLRRNGPFNIPIYGTDANVVWRGGFRRSALHTTLRVKGATYRKWGGATESVRLALNGSVVTTHSVPTALGESYWELSASLGGYADGSVVSVVVDYVRSAPSAEGSPINHWSIQEAMLEPAAGAAASLGAWQVRQASVTAASLLAWAQAAASLASSIKSRIDGNGAMWGVQRLYSMRSGFDDFQLQFYEESAIPYVPRRTGEAIVGRGRALSLGYGAGWFDEAEYAQRARSSEGNGAWPVKNARTHAVVDGDDVESFALYLDSPPGLPPGAPFNVRGWESYVLMERLKVVE